MTETRDDDLMRFKSLEIRNWKQFHHVDIEFHDRLTVLTGSNASGKTTLLNLLGRHFGWEFPELSTPIKESESGKIRFVRPLFSPFYEDLTDGTIGEITYADGSKTRIAVPDFNTVGPVNESAAYHLPLFNQKVLPLKGIYIPSDRPEFLYEPIEQIPRGKNRQEAFSLVSDSHRRRLLETVSSTRYMPCYHIKETLISWGIFGFRSEVIAPNQEYKDMYIGFQNILKEILPEETGFEKFSIRESELVLVTRSGEFMIDAVSGGMGALIDLAWQIYTFSENGSEPFTVLIDEVETHLHANMQRKILPDFLEAFPNAQFIVSTHSPLVVSSVRDSSVYALKFNEESRIESIKLDITAKAKDAVDILKGVLGVSFTMPVWVEEKLNEINEKYSKLEINEDTFASLREELTEIGLEDLVPYSIDKILSSK